ncbi:hypothetical protein [Deinococcus radiophilus]|uniref:hypothetical protein n=1 Tax=Deinococcus radiophilus TaxID=32062 RepID=UPI00361C733D
MRKQVLTLALALLAAPGAGGQSLFRRDHRPEHPAGTDLELSGQRLYRAPDPECRRELWPLPGELPVRGLRIDGLLTVPGGSPPRGG